MEEFEEIKTNSSDLILEKIKVRFGPENVSLLKTIANNISLYHIVIPKEKISILTYMGLKIPLTQVDIFLMLLRMPKLSNP